MPPSVTELSAPPLSSSPPLQPSSSNLLRECLDLVSGDLRATEVELRGLLDSAVTVIPEIGAYLTAAGGKRFRPLLSLLCAKAAGYTDPARITIAAVGELLHSATLLHDDVVDDGEFRRGRPAARMAFGNGLAVLTGDYCLARALQTVAATGSLPAVQSLADTVTLMAQGEIEQLDGAGLGSLDVERYLGIIERKTATLIAWCSSVAFLVGEPYATRLHRFGLELGYAFQITDDVLDVRAVQSDTGKRPGQDIREGKMTLPVILACAANPALHATVLEVLAAGPPVSETAARSILAAVVASGAADEAMAMASARIQHAVECLAVLPDSPARDALQAVAHYTVRRHR